MTKPSHPKNIFILVCVLCIATLCASNKHTSPVESIWCGTHISASCSDCLALHTCGGDCTLAKPGKCIKKNVQCGPFSNTTKTVTASECGKCPPGKDGACSSDDCIWIPSTKLCRPKLNGPNSSTATVALLWDPNSYAVSFTSKKEPSWFLQQLVVTDISNVTFYGMNGHKYGYSGVQSVRPGLGRVVFSIWDPDMGDNGVVEVVACGSGVTCDDFGNGENDDLTFEVKMDDQYEDLLPPPQPGRKMAYLTSKDVPAFNEKYYFMTQAFVDVDFTDKSEEASWIGYSGYFYAEKLGGWKFLATIRVQNKQKHERLWYHHGLYSFVQQWYPIQATDLRSAMFGPAYVSDVTFDPSGESFELIPTASFAYDTVDNHERVYAFRSGKESMGIATGGKNSTLEQSTLRRRPAWEKFHFDDGGNLPGPLLQFAGFIPCLDGAESTLEVEHCFL